MNNNHVIAICHYFNLGTPLQAPTGVHGGLLHNMWRLDTDKGSFAIKQLSKDINLKNEHLIKNYNLTEEIASRFSAQGIPAISALSQNKNYLTLFEGTGFLIYPWVEANALHKDRVSEYHALKIAEILAKMHAVNLSVPEMTQPEYDIHSSANLIELTQKAQHHQCPFSTELIKLQDDIIEINTAFQNMLPLLKTQIVVSHGDLDQKNVLWDKNNNPILIDWECARKLNPIHEIVNAGLDWSGITTNFNQAIFFKMLKAYSASGGNLDKNTLPAAFNAVLGNWINWMAYNIERACRSDLEQKTLGIEQVTLVLDTIVQLKTVIPQLMDAY